MCQWARSICSASSSSVSPSKALCARSLPSGSRSSAVRQEGAYMGKVPRRMRGAVRMYADSKKLPAGYSDSDELASGGFCPGDDLLARTKMGRVEAPAIVRLAG